MPPMEMVNRFDPNRATALSNEDRALVGRREALLGPSYRLFYQEPVNPVRADGVWLYDRDGKRYLDTYNNVPSVGHCHPHVVQAVAKQAAVLNTHTRYLGDQILDYAERLLATLPDEIDRIMFTCTGSEAVDLALRVARWHTGGEGIIVTENAYHGVTAEAAAISPTLGKKVPLGPHVMTVPAPDWRKAEGGEVATAFAGDVKNALDFMLRHGIKPAAFIADSIFSTDGVFPDPAGFLRPTVELLHQSGALYIADEVQPGFGRTGAQMWGFQRHRIVPDIVVMGKPMGNGIPIAAAVMKAEVQETFGRDVRYFNTFGGNHVSIAAASAVLDVIRDEGLMQNAEATGLYMQDGMRALADRFPAIGHVRGAGLFLALEFLTVDAAREPDGALALHVVNDMRRHGVLISSTGPFNNVLKIRPPLPFDRSHADIFLGVLEGVLTRATEHSL